MVANARSGTEIVFEALRQHGAMPISDLEKLLASNRGGIGFGVEPYHVIGSMLQYGQLEYGGNLGIVRESNKERLKEKGCQYAQALISEHVNGMTVAKMEEFANGPQKRLYDSLRELRSVYGNEHLAKIFNL